MKIKMTKTHNKITKIWTKIKMENIQIKTNACCQYSICHITNQFQYDFQTKLRRPKWTSVTIFYSSCRSKPLYFLEHILLNT